MSALWGTLGYEDIAHRISEHLASGTGMALIDGPPGVGKSWLAKGIGSLWEEGGGSPIVAEGDGFKSGLAYYPLEFAMAGLSNGWRSIATGAVSAAKAAEALLGTAGVITTTIQGLVRLRRASRKQQSVYLGDREQGVLHNLERFAKKRPILLIADNLHWWDEPSLGLLWDIQQPAMRNAFGFLEDLRVLAVQTISPYQSIAHPGAYRHLVGSAGSEKFSLRRIPQEGFAEVLAALGDMPAPPSDVADIVHSLSGGHLVLASRAALRIKDGEADTFLAAADADDFLRALVSDRILSLGELGEQAIDLLRVAAVLGLSFRREEVICAAGIGEDQTARLLRQCRDEQVLNLRNGDGWFVHDIFRTFFLEAGANDLIEIHERIGECLRVLRPAAYDVRSLNALKAERPAHAATLGVVAALQRLRDARPWRDLPAEVLDVVAERGLEVVIEQFATAFEHLKRYEYRECLASLERLPRDIAKPVRAEADYIRAMCRMSTRSEADRERGRTILSLWSGYEEEEPEQGIRLARLYLYGLSHLLDKGPGIELEGRIKAVLGERVSFDSAAKDELYTMDRCSASLYLPDIAVIRNQEAADYFAPDAGQTVVRRPLEYYRCLVNLGSNLIQNGRYDDALSVYDDLAGFVEQFGEDVFPRLDYPRSNRLLAEYRLGLVTPAEACERQRAIVSELGVEGDPYYPRNALGVYLTLAGRGDEATEIFDWLETELTRRHRDPEPSMVYLIRANRCATRFVSGHEAACQEEWPRLAEVVTRIAYVIQPVLVRRHQLLGECIAAGAVMSPIEFDEYLPREKPFEFGPLWANFGRGFRMPEIEFWREN